MKIKITILTLLLTLYYGVLLPGSVKAQEAQLQEIVVTNSSKDLLLYLKVANAFTPELLNGVQNGLPVTFSYQVSLNLVRSGWLNKEIYAGSVDHTLIYDNLKKEYTIIEAENSDKFITNNLAEAQKMMVELNGLRVVPLTDLEADRRYILRVRVVLDKKTLPFHFNYLIPFSFWNLETDWYSVEFRY